MKTKIISDVEFLTFENLEKLGFVKHAFSTRIGGVSTQEFASMNLSFKRGDDQDNVMRNFEKFSHAINIPLNNFVMANQSHSTNVMCVTKADCGSGIFKDTPYHDIDGLLTDECNVALVTSHADCAPLYFVDVKNKVVGIAHAGWRGTINGIAHEMIISMKQNYGSLPENIICDIGPCVCKSCFEIDQITAEHFKAFDACEKDESSGKFLASITDVNKKILLKDGLKEENIYISDICTSCNGNKFFSQRKHGNRRGSMIAVIELCRNL